MTTTDTVADATRTHLGEMLRLYRTVRGRSVRDVAEQIGTTPSTVTRIEHGRAFDVETMLKLWAWMLAGDPAAMATD